MRRRNSHKAREHRAYLGSTQLTSWLLRYWDSIRTSFWAIPALLTFSALLLAGGLMFLETQKLLPSLGLMETKPAEARQILATIAAAAISIAGVTFSIVIVVLTLASSQFGSRLIRSFVHDRPNQIVLGVFVATFAYCLTLLGSIGSYGNDIVFVPKLALLLAVVLALIDIAVFIYFIHHLAISIQSPNVIHRVGLEMDVAIDQWFPEKTHDTPAPPNSDSISIQSNENGYVLALDVDGIVSLAEALNIKVRCLVEVGEFVLYGKPLLEFWHEAGDELSEEDKHSLRNNVLLASQRSPVQDVTFAFSQLVEISVRALSPGINDPFTAMNAANRLSAALLRIDGREEPHSTYFIQAKDDTEELPCLWLRCRSKASYVDTMFASLVEYADTSPLVNQHLLSLIDRLLDRLQGQPMRNQLGEYVSLIKPRLQSGLTQSQQKNTEALLDRIEKKLAHNNDAETETNTGSTGD